MPALPTLPWVLLVQPQVESHVAAARAWGYRIGVPARDALVASDALERTIGDRDMQVRALFRHFGLSNKQHSLHAEPLAWLRLGETLATKGLQHFLASSDARASFSEGARADDRLAI